MMNRSTALPAVVVALLVVTGCTGAKKAPASLNGSAGVHATSPPGIPATKKPAAPTAKPAKTKPAKRSKPAAPPINPLTGGKPVAGPVIAVKIDDTGPGRPQIAIDKADVVYIELAEGGLDRLIAVYDTNLPTVGYVRSIRLTDPDLLLQYGKITLAASGGSGRTRRHLKASGLPSYLMDGKHPYFQRRSHADDHGYINVLLDLAKVAKVIKRVRARNVGFVWKLSPPGLSARPRATSIQTRVGSQGVSFAYDARTRRYVRKIGGVIQHAADGKPVSTPNVIVQECKITATTALDPVGAHQQFTRTIGSGVVHVYRSGRVYAGTWSRRSANAPTVFRDAKGVQIPLAPGGVWVALVKTRTPITVS